VASKGKPFEEAFKEACVKLQPSVSVDRLYDPQGRLKNVRNICDFIVFKYPNQYYFELKDYALSRINFKVISEDQLTGLLKKSQLEHVVAGVIFNFRLHESAYFVNIQRIYELMLDGHKSISVQEAAEIGFLLPGGKKITRFRYDVHSLLSALEKEDFKC